MERRGTHRLVCLDGKDWRMNSKALGSPLFGQGMARYARSPIHLLILCSFFGVFVRSWDHSLAGLLVHMFVHLLVFFLSCSLFTFAHVHFSVRSLRLR